MPDQARTSVLALLGVKLARQDVVPRNRGAERRAIVGHGHDEALVIGDAVVAVHEVVPLLVLEHGMLAVDLVPSDVRNLEQAALRIPQIRREALHPAWKDPEALFIGGLFARLEQGLHPEANAEIRTTAVDPRPHGLADLSP